MAKDNELVIRINGNIKGYQDALKAATQQTASLQDNLNTIAKTGAVAFAGLGASILLAAKSAGKFETVEAQFETLLGSVEESQKAIKELSDFTAKTPFRFEQVAQAGKQLLAFKVAADQLKPTLRAIGDVAAATGANFNDLTLIFGQVKAAGKLTGERLLQLEERAVPIGPALAKTMGVAETAIRDLVSQGEIDFKTFEKAFKSLSEEGGLAFEGMEKRSKTLEGQLSTLSDNFDLLTAEIGKNFVPTLKEVTAAVTGFLGYLRENPALSEFISRALVAGTVVGGLVTVLALGATAFLKIRASILAATLATRGLSFAVKGLVGSTGLGLLVAFLPEILEVFKSIFPKAKAVFLAFAETISQTAKGLLNIIGGIFSLDINAIKKGLKQLAGAVAAGAQEATKEYEKIAQAAERQKAETQKAAQETTKIVQKSQKAKTDAVIKGTDKRLQKLQDENEIVQAQLADAEKEEIAFLKRRQEIQQKERDAQIIQDQERRALALENVELLYAELESREAAHILAKEELQAEAREAEAALQEELQALDKEKRDALQQEELDSLKKSFEDKEKIRSKAVKAEIIAKRKEDAIRAADEEMFGKTIAGINAFFRSEEVKGAKTATQELVQLQNSKNAQLKAIGKVAAITQIAIDTQRGAIAAYAALAGIPIVGPVLGAGAAAALIAYGAERTAGVLAAQEGGLVPGTGFGDSQRALLEPGELITPRQNFEEVVTAVADQRLAQQGVDTGFGLEDDEDRLIGRIDVNYQSEEAADIITIQQNEQGFLGTSQQILLGAT